MTSAAPPDAAGCGRPVAAESSAAESSAEAPDAGAAVRRRSRATLLCTVALAGAAGAAAVLVNRGLFPLYSANRDDAVYVAMSRVIEHGHLTIPIEHWPFRPWASGAVGDHIVFKYPPPWPAVLAAGSVLGSAMFGLAACAAATVVAVRALAVEVVHDTTTAVVAAALLVLSPMFLVQSGTYLPYLFSLGLCAGASALLLAGVRVGSSRRLAVGGLVAGIAVFARPFDAVLLLVPVGVAVLVTATSTTTRRRATTAIAAGALPVVIANLAYNWIVVGSPTSLPFSVTGSADAFGFGRRGVFESSTVPFDFGDGLAGAGVSLRWLPSWIFGGPVLLALAVVAMVVTLRRGRGPARWAIASWVLVVPFAYLFFWGPWAMTSNWDGVEMFGPFYHLPLLVPAVVFGAHGLRMLWARTPPVTAVALVAMVAFTVWSVPDKITRNDDVTDQYRAVEQAVDGAGLHDAVLFLPLRGDAGFLTITPFLEYDPDLDAEVLYAEDCGTAANRAVLGRFPDRSGFRLEVIDEGRRSRASSYAVRPVDSDSDSDSTTRRVRCVGP